jgi:hypothetical protein
MSLSHTILVAYYQHPSQQTCCIYGGEYRKYTGCENALSISVLLIPILQIGILNGVADIHQTGTAFFLAINKACFPSDCRTKQRIYTVVVITTTLQENA